MGAGHATLMLGSAAAVSHWVNTHARPGSTFHREYTVETLHNVLNKHIIIREGARKLVYDHVQAITKHRCDTRDPDTTQGMHCTCCKVGSAQCLPPLHWAPLRRSTGAKAWLTRLRRDPQYPPPPARVPYIHRDPARCGSIAPEHGARGGAHLSMASSDQGGAR